MIFTKIICSISIIWMRDAPINKKTSTTSTKFMPFSLSCSLYSHSISISLFLLRSFSSSLSLCLYLPHFVRWINFFPIAFRLRFFMQCARTLSLNYCSKLYVNSIVALTWEFWLRYNLLRRLFTLSSSEFCSFLLIFSSFLIRLLVMDKDFVF